MRDIVITVLVGVALTAVISGLLVPYLKDYLDRQSEQYKSSVALIETLAGSLWAYWKAALRVAYYGKQGERGSKELCLALDRWDSDGSWQVGNEIQIQVSRSKRLLPRDEQQKKLDEAQRTVVNYLDQEVDCLRKKRAKPDEWEALYNSIMDKREEIDKLLSDATADLNLRGTALRRGIRRTRDILRQPWREPPAHEDAKHPASADSRQERTPADS